MTRLAIVVEGQTEEEFVKRLLISTLQHKNISAHPVCMNGNVTVERLASDMARLYWSFDFVTSLVDFYGFQGKGDAAPDQLQAWIDAVVRQKISVCTDQPRVFSYVQQHEFEGLLFSDVFAFAHFIGANDRTVAALQRIRGQFQTPEDINDDPNTAPSKRIKDLLPRYQKVVDGPTIAEDIGLDKIRSECFRFNHWLSRLESLGG